MMRLPSGLTLLYLAATVVSFVILNFHGWFKWCCDRSEMVSSIGWPATILGLSSDPVTIPVPGLSITALAVDAVLGVTVVVGAGLVCRKLLRTTRVTALLDVRAILMITGIVGTWLAVIKQEIPNTNVSQMLFEVSRVWVFCSIVIAWCIFNTKLCQTQGPNDGTLVTSDIDDEYRILAPKTNR